MKDKYISITPMNEIGRDNRGETFTYETRSNSMHIFLSRKKGTISGNTYHTGKSANTSPKMFVLLSGEIILSYRHINSNFHNSVKVEKPSVITVEPYVTHSVEAVTEILMIECNSIEDIQGDRVIENVETTLERVS